MSESSDPEAKAPAAIESAPGPVPGAYPDDSPLAARLRTIDRYAGYVEQAVLFGLLAIIVLVGAAQAFANKAFQHSFSWSFDVIRDGTFAIAMIAAAFASQQGCHLTMDIVSRMINPRARQLVRVVTAALVIFATGILLYSGLHLVDAVASEGGHTDAIAALVPGGCLLIMFHTAIQLVIELDYFVRGRQQPEKMPTGH